MNLLGQVFFLNQAKVGAASGGFGGFIALVLGFSGLLFLQPYYNAFIKSATAAIGVSPFNSIVPLTLMAMALAMGIGSFFVRLSRQRKHVLYVILSAAIRFVIIMMSIPLFIFSLIHWLFYTSG